MVFIDWVIVLFYLLFVMVLGFWFMKQGGKSMQDFFVAGRKLPWWLAGTSMVATSFAADTPLAVTEFVYKEGIGGNWYWWSFAIQGMMVTFLFAHLWRRAQVVTDVEFFELRYAGKAAAFLRGMKACIGSLLANGIILGWVMLAMASVVEVMIPGLKSWHALGLSLILALSYGLASGLWGVVVTDLFQFALAMGGSVYLAVVAVQKVGGLKSLSEQITLLHGEGWLHFIPSPGEALWMTFLIYIGLQWWCASNADSGGGIIVQRLSATTNTRHAVLSSLWFNIAHYCLRAWPWILTALAICILYPQLSSPRLGYPKMMMDLIPTGLRGLMVASFLAAFMSTVDTHLNWAASYMVNDLYKRFIKPKASQEHYVWISRGAMILASIISVLVALNLKSISGAWKLLTLMGAGAGLVKIMRWFWWRINAWSEISAMVASLTFSLILLHTPFNYGTRLVFNVLASGLVWIGVTMLTPPVKEEQLKLFYARVRPPRMFWGPIAKELPEITSDPSWQKLQAWGLGVVGIYSLLFGVGKVLLLHPWQGFFLIFLGIIAFIGVGRRLKFSPTKPV